MSSRRRWSYGLVDQAVIAVANAGNSLLATAVLPPAKAGVVLVSIATTYVAMGINRAFIGDVLLTQTSRFEGARHRRMFTDAMACAACSGALVATLFALAWLVWPGDILAPLIVIAPFIPAIFLHDTARYAYQSQLRQDRALFIDLVWLGTQIAGVVLGALLGRLSGPWLLASWGIGAGTAAGVYLLRGGIAFWQGSPLRWLSGTRHLSGWFTGTALIGQTQTQLLALAIPGLLGPTAYAGLRLAQLLILQPVQNFVQAAMGLLVPRIAALAAARDSRRLGQLIKRALLAGVALAALVMATVVIAADPLLQWYRGGEYAEIAPLTWPVALQAGVYLMQLPLTAALRGTQQGARLFSQYAIFTTTSLLAAGTGAALAGITGTAWGLTIGAVIGAAVMGYFAWRALNGLTTPEESTASVPRPAPGPTAQPQPLSERTLKESSAG